MSSRGNRLSYAKIQPSFEMFRMIFNLFDALFDFFPLFYEDKLLYTKMGHQSEWHNSLQNYLLLNKAKKNQYHN